MTKLKTSKLHTDDAARSADARTAPEATSGPYAPRTGSKIANVVRLLHREEGATLTDLIEITGWKSHTTRAALSGLRKKGYVVEKAKRENVTFYYIAGES